MEAMAPVLLKVDSDCDPHVAGSHRVRLHAPGGIVSPEDWTVLSQVSSTFGNGTLKLVGHSCVEISGISTEVFDEAIAQLSQTDFTTSHIVLASSLCRGARQFAHRLSLRIHSLMQGPQGASKSSGSTREPELVVGIVDGSDTVVTHVQGQPVDIGVRLGKTVDVFMHGVPKGEFSDTEAAIELIAHHAYDAPSTEVQQSVAVNKRPIGWLTEHHEEALVDVGAGFENDEIDAENAGLLGVMGATISLTPCKGVIIHDLPEADADVVVRVLAPRGFIFDLNSPLLKN